MIILDKERRYFVLVIQVYEPDVSCDCDFDILFRAVFLLTTAHTKISMRGFMLIIQVVNFTEDNVYETFLPDKCFKVLL